MYLLSLCVLNLNSLANAKILGVTHQRIRHTVIDQLVVFYGTALEFGITPMMNCTYHYSGEGPNC